MVQRRHHLGRRLGRRQAVCLDLDDGDRDTGKDILLHSSNAHPRGIWSNGVTIWVADSGDDRLFAYGLEDGVRKESLEVDLHARNNEPWDVWSDGDTIWVVNDASGSGAFNRVFSYHLPE